MATPRGSHKLTAADHPPTRARHGYRDDDFAFTSEERDAAQRTSAATPPPRSDVGGVSQRRRPPGEKFVYVDDNGDDFAVSLDAESVLFTVEFRTATALLRLPDARHLARFLGGTIEHWRSGAAFPYVAPRPRTPDQRRL